MPKKKDRPVLDPKPVLHIYCEGQKTEPNYIQAYIDQNFSANRRLKVIKIEHTPKNTAKELVTEASNQKKKSPEGDEFWVVYDRESIHRYSDHLHKIAQQKAHRNDVHLALSNVCFEVWLLLHFEASTRPYSDYDDLKSNSTLRTECKNRGLPDYDKGEKAIFSIFKNEEIDEARKRAESMNASSRKSAAASHTEPYQLNPYTDVYKLLDAIDAFVKNSNK